MMGERSFERKRKREEFLFTAKNRERKEKIVLPCLELLQVLID